MALFRDTLKGLAYFLSGSVLRKTLDSYCRLTTANGENVLLADDGSLVSLFRLEGCRSVKGTTELSQIVAKLRLALASQFSTKGFTLQFWFGHLPDAGRAEVENVLSGMASIARNAEIDIEDLIEERRRRMPEKLTGERAYIVVWSRSALLSREEQGSSFSIVAEDTKQIPPSGDAQVPTTPLPALLTRHDAVIEALKREARLCDIDVTLLNVREALSEIKGVLNPEFLAAGNKWKAMLPGDYIRARMPDTAAELKGKSFSHFLWPSLKTQIMTENGALRGDRIFEFGDRIYAGFDIVAGPEQVVAFNDLISRVLDQKRKISWRVSMLIDSGGFQGQAFKETYASLLTFTAKMTNGRIKRAFETARMANGDGETVVRWRCSFAVWCDRSEEKQLLTDVATLRQAVHAWGNSQTDMQAGDHVECVMSSALGISAASTAPAASAYLSEALAMAPVARPASPWQKGSVQFRTNDGKLWHYQPGSSKQGGWVDIIIGQPGMGKSFLSNTMNLSIALSPQVGRSSTGASLLPRISIIDIGSSSEGFINMIREALPVYRRHEVLHLRLQNTPLYAVNPFDTQLCVRKPFAYEMEYLVNLVCLTCTPDDRTMPYDGISDLIRAAIEEAYAYYSDDRSPKRYGPTDSSEVDNSLKELGFVVDNSTTWWEVVDFLFARGRCHQAALAQRFAVPVLRDLITSSSEETVKEPYRDMHVQSTGEPVLAAFHRMITATLRDFPILADPTRFSVADARIIAFDLEAVTSNVGPNAHRKSAVMYMLARHTITTDFWLHEDDLKQLQASKEVIDYHLKRVNDNKQMHKRIAYDEYHRTGGLTYFRKQVENDNRIGRKTGVQQSYTSQLIDDFDTSTQELANNFFFCNVPSENSIQELGRRYNLSETVKKLIRGLNGPIPGQGAPFIAMMKLKEGRYIQHLINDTGPIENWALSTTQEDTALRGLLYQSMGPKLARQVLAKRFPNGSATDVIELRKLDLEAGGHMIDDDAKTNIIRNLADEIIRDFGHA